METTCKGCGAVYWISGQHIPVRDSDSIDCQECGAELYAWHKVSQNFTATLKQHGNRYRGGQPG